MRMVSNGYNNRIRRIPISVRARVESFSEGGKKGKTNAHEIIQDR